MSNKHPWMKFYPADWRAEPRLRCVSRAARSLWVDLLCLIYEGGDGRLHMDGVAPTDQQLARMLGDNPRTLKKLLAELEEAGVFSRDGDGFIISRRIIRDFEKAEKDANNGRKGGNPSLKKNAEPNKNNKLCDEGVNPQVKAHIPEARSQSLEKEKNTKKERPDFELFWQAYPRRKTESGSLVRGSKANAEKVWRRMTAADRGKAKIGVESYKLAHPDKSKFVRDAERWLRDEGWRDLVEVERSRPPPVSDEDWELRMKMFRERGLWSADWGARPGEAGCQVPRKFLVGEAVDNQARLDACGWR